jgi:1A family penicillin-binding protein
VPKPAPQTKPGAHARKPAKPQRERTTGMKIARVFFMVSLVGVVLFFAVVALGAAGYIIIAAEVPDANQLMQKQSTFASTKIFDRNGNLILELTDPTDVTAGRRTHVSLSQISKYAQQATIATEDPNFYRYSVGFDPVALVRVVYYAITERDFVSGGSTITQQVARNLLLTPEERNSRSLMRKLREIVLANAVAERYSRDQILEIYMNEIFYGNQSYGIEAASETYFNKPASELDLAEASMLVGIPQSPVLWDPVTNKENTLRRQATVLRLMVQAGYITQSQVQPAEDKIAAMTFSAPANNYSTIAPHFMTYVRQVLDNDFGTDGLYRTGLRVYTTLDTHIQSIAEQAVKDQIAKLTNQHVNNGAAVVLNPQTGEVLAMVGSADFNSTAISGQVNVALSLRQPGSSIKPFNYLAAFEKGYTPATMLWDTKTTFTNQYGQQYTPTNYDGKFRGAVLLRNALAQSLNVPAVKTLEYVTIPDFLKMTERVNIHFPPNDQYGLALTLGGGEVRLLDLTSGYGVLANSGVLMTPTVISKVVLPDGQVQHDYLQNNTMGQVVDPNYAYLITSILSDNAARTPAFGANSVLKTSRPTAVKTGTTNDYRDNLTVGYTPDLVVGVWVGNTDNSEMEGVTGVTGAAPIWHEIIEKATEGTPVKDFTRPSGIIEAEICLDGGHAPSASCPANRRAKELFKQGQGPLPADENVERAARENNPDLTNATPAPQVQTQSQIIISQPADGGSVSRGVLSIRGTVNPPGFQSYQVEWGDGDNPGEWKWISGPHLSAVVDNQITQWGIENMPAGRYTIRVTASTSSGTLIGYSHFDIAP